MAAAELALVAAGLTRAGLIDLEDVEPIERITDGRSQLLRFDTVAPVERLRAVVGQLSASAALFRHVPGGAGRDLLEPVSIAERLAFPSELATTQRYRGKTNERLTRAMLNTALAGAGIDPSEPTGVVLDPMCGRGTTLNWALAYGLDGVGIEADGSALGHHATFLETWAKRNRLPHKLERFRRANAEQRAMRFRVATDRQRLRSGDGPTVATFAADGADSSLAVKRGSIDAIVCDLPYGVQHRGSSSAGSSSDDTASLLERVLPVWHRWLRPGGAICLAWNLRRCGRDELGAVLAAAGFTPITLTGGHSMGHRVDATIERDVIVANGAGPFPPGAVAW